MPGDGSIDLTAESGFVALIDFIEPRRSNAVVRIRKGVETSTYLSFTRTKKLIDQGVLGPPLWYIYDRAWRILKQEPELTEERLSDRVGNEGARVVRARGCPVDPASARFTLDPEH